MRMWAAPSAGGSQQLLPHGWAPGRWVLLPIPSPACAATPLPTAARIPTLKPRSTAWSNAIPSDVEAAPLASAAAKRGQGRPLAEEAPPDLSDSPTAKAAAKLRRSRKGPKAAPPDDHQEQGAAQSVTAQSSSSRSSADAPASGPSQPAESTVPSTAAGGHASATDGNGKGQPRARKRKSSQPVAPSDPVTPPSPTPAVIPAVTPSTTPSVIPAVTPVATPSTTPSATPVGTINSSPPTPRTYTPKQLMRAITLTRSVDQLSQLLSRYLSQAALLQEQQSSGHSTTGDTGSEGLHGTSSKTQAHAAHAAAAQQQATSDAQQQGQPVAQLKVTPDVPQAQQQQGQPPQQQAPIVDGLHVSAALHKLAQLASSGDGMASVEADTGGGAGAGARGRGKQAGKQRGSDGSSSINNQMGDVPAIPLTRLSSVSSLSATTSSSHVWPGRLTSHSSSSRGSAAEADVMRLAGQLLYASMGHMEDLGWREISSMLWALATLRLIPTLRANSSNSSSSLNSNATDASNSQTPTTDVTHKSAQAASASIIGSAPELTSNPKSGQAGSTRQDRQQSDWVSAALARLQALGSARADPQSLSNTAWALGKLGIAPSKGWLDDYLKAVQGSLALLEAQHLSNILYGLALMGAQPSKTWLQAYLVQVAAAMPGLRPSSQSTPSLLQPAAASGGGSRSEGRQSLPPPRMYSMLMLPQQYSNVLYALAVLGYRPNKAWMQRYLTATLALLSRSLPPKSPPALKGKATANTTGPATQDHQEQPQQQQGQQWPLQSAPLLPQHVSNTGWALAKLGVTPPGWWRAVYEQALKAQAPHMSAQELCTVLYAYARWRVAPADASLSSLILSWVMKRRGGLSLHGLATVIWSLAWIHIVSSRQQGHQPALEDSNTKVVRYPQQHQPPQQFQGRARGGGRTTTTASTHPLQVPSIVSKRTAAEGVRVTSNNPARAAAVASTAGAVIAAVDKQQQEVNAWVVKLLTGVLPQLLRPSLVRSVPLDSNTYYNQDKAATLHGQETAQPSPSGAPVTSVDGSGKHREFQVAGGRDKHREFQPLQAQALGNLVWGLGVLACYPGRQTLGLLIEAAETNPSACRPGPARRQIVWGIKKLTGKEPELPVA